MNLVSRKNPRRKLYNLHQYCSVETASNMTYVHIKAVMWDITLVDSNSCLKQHAILDWHKITLIQKPQK